MARTIDTRPYVFCFESFITGHHIYKEIWGPTLNELLICEREPESTFDRNAVKVLKGEDVVGHIPKQFSKTCNFILLAGGKISATVTGPRQNKRKNGLEVPCLYHVKATQERGKQAEAIIKEFQERITKKQ